MSTPSRSEESLPPELEALNTAIYDELHRLAVAAFRRESPAHTLQPTALVHEAYLRLARAPNPAWQGQSHFYAVAARAMRQILINHARDRQRQKRGGGRHRVSLEAAMPVSEMRLDLEALDEALDELFALDRRKGQVVELRYFGGLSVEETARVLDVAPSTVKSDWTFAKAWLLQRMA